RRPASRSGDPARSGAGDAAGPPRAHGLRRGGGPEQPWCGVGRIGRCRRARRRGSAGSVEAVTGAEESGTGEHEGGGPEVETGPPPQATPADTPFVPEAWQPHPPSADLRPAAAPTAT